ncbi:MAG: ATPase domain-containing protein, partial [Steroidobacteraceae bacterium]
MNYPEHAGVPRCTIGIKGLDYILAGGLPIHRMYLVRGGPGTGKTTLSLQFLQAGRDLGEPVLYITLSESEQELALVAQSHGWALDNIAVLGLARIETMIKPEVQSTILHPSEHELGRTLAVIQQEIARIRPKRIVLDSLAELRLLAQNPLRFRRQILNLKSFFTQHEATVLLLDEHNEDTEPQVQTLVHGVIELQMRNPEFGPTRRRLSVLKMRGVKFRAGYHDLIIDTGGLDVFPRLVAAEHFREFSREPRSTGVREVDQLLGGGIEPGTSTLITGAAGTGKSSLALQFATSAARRGESVAYFSFDESIATMQARMEGLGMDAAGLKDRGLFHLNQIDPAELSPGEFAAMVCRCVEQRTKVVIIDSLNGYLHSMPDERLLVTQLHELLSYLAQQGVITLLLLTQQGIVGDVNAPVDLSYLADCVVLLRYFEVDGAMKKAISVVKKRSGGHEETIREFKLLQRTG